MGKVNSQTHDLMLRGGFKYDAAKDKYFMRGEAVWDVQKRIDKGKKQLAVPAASLEEFHKQEEVMVDALLEKLKKKAAEKGKTPKGEDEADDAEEAPKPKKRKQSDAGDDAEAEDAEAEAPKKKKKKAKEVEEEEE
mmetsp:Transcript_100295/g.178317  ORF Transcript_100295/g.178317 Transcript_100295/m.178317 type:complete len:136 (+) Transcript_100295:49-456(+)|eukprot:CAMPEP_0197651140 /NCGR_PEP_ID=MMETSP1338-20131121/31377_1 /TAXON_ID=43686 ORGANISM="Pelagodinium beii, Strain RCC1491" /NCGR_SAMPLE_ID=MMETSP1338 /ASSEMBLY_ACC=CAM_ASM_000754 /LENGTH=135 /DNA_ID=CAMNT_0043225703 /DNA_START=41 /DNA_END=448 /DNA_ORIENTATION=-